MNTPDCRPGAAGCRALIVLMLTGAPAAAGAQTTTPQAPSVIVPHAGIDPGMRIKPPRLPAGSTPVIKPRTTPSPGSRTVVVPK